MPLSSIKNAGDLITSRKAICEGFLKQAIEKSKRASPYIVEAKEFWDIVTGASSIDELLAIPAIQNQLFAVSGFSNKAKTHLSNQELNLAVRQVLDNLTQKSNSDWRNEIFYRYLLTRGDSLGGTMRNVTGALAGSRFATFIINALSNKKIKPEIKHSKSNQEKIQSLRWENRLLVFDKTPKFIGKNIDLILLNVSSSKKSERNLINDPQSFIACGELKGGIDPAGADEHWKTANSALQRIRESFTINCPELFFVGAAIEHSMAEEIFTQISIGALSYAANFTVEEQVSELISWLVSL